MNITPVNNQRFQGNVAIPNVIKPKLEHEVLSLLGFNTKKITDFSRLIERISAPEHTGNIRFIPKPGIYEPASMGDYDVYVSDTLFSPAKTLTENFVEAVKRVAAKV